MQNFVQGLAQSALENTEILLTFLEKKCLFQS